MKADHRIVRRTLEFAVAVSALVTSVTSIWLSMRQGDDMSRLVQAQSWPYLEYETSNVSDGEPAIDIAVRNAGIGPAKVRSFSVMYERKALRGWATLIRTCCIPDGKTIESTQDLAALVDNKMVSSQLIQHVLRPSESVTLLHLPKTEANSALWKKLDDARFKLYLRACYCSVFDECWMSDLRGGDQQSVQACPVDAIPYVE